MRYQRVAIENLAHTLADDVVTTTEIERRLAPLYARLRLPAGRLELMTGIRERRFFPSGCSIGEISIRTANRAIEASGIDRRHFGALVHGSVCRDYLEPATACSVHHALGLPANCAVYDVSNACLGILTGALQIANMIELSQIRAGIVVGTECGRSLVENTIATLNADRSLNRSTIKDSIASLTIGSASAAIVLCDRELSRTSNRLVAATVHSDTTHHSLCHSEGLSHVMQTDSEQLMRAGVATGMATFEQFLDDAGWSRDKIDRTFCHQVGVAHRKLLLESLRLDPTRDFATFEYLGNTGSAALPATMSIGIEQGFVTPGQNIAMLGIGSGINCTMLAVEWNAGSQSQS
jgi:3-oxoacyl-[acyl-carrier-protein] synthase-3